MTPFEQIVREVLAKARYRELERVVVGGVSHEFTACFEGPDGSHNLIAVRVPGEPESVFVRHIAALCRSLDAVGSGRTITAIQPDSASDREHDSPLEHDVRSYARDLRIPLPADIQSVSHRLAPVLPPVVAAGNAGERVDPWADLSPGARAALLELRLDHVADDGSDAVERRFLEWISAPFREPRA